VVRQRDAYGIVLDGTARSPGVAPTSAATSIVAVLTEKVSDAHQARLRTDGVSYSFAGERDLDLGLALGQGQDRRRGRARGVRDCRQMRVVIGVGTLRMRIDQRGEQDVRALAATNQGCLGTAGKLL
jgi:hypothetical protein